MTDRSPKLDADFVHLARIALTSRPQDVQLLLHRAVKRYRSTHPEMAHSLADLLREAPTRQSPLRRQSETPLPVDGDSRIKLLKVEHAPILEHDPVFPGDISKRLQRLVDERRNPQLLIDANLQPTRTGLLVGPPGVGKTMAARWLALQLKQPLLILDLAAVMSSYLGRTGNNLRGVFDYAKESDSILFLDELDAIAKRRDDSGEIGELKRLVTVLIQEIDDWPSSRLLIAASNHPQLLDPAIWRRFEVTFEFSLPTAQDLSVFIENALRDYVVNPQGWGKVLGLCMVGASFSSVEQKINEARRASALEGTELSHSLSRLLQSLPTSKAERISLARSLVEQRILSQRQATQLTKVARDTIRKRETKS